MNLTNTTSWLQRQSRLLTAGIAMIGVIVTTHLTIAKFSGNSLACPTLGCDRVLSSPYATLAGLPISLYGFLAYFLMVVLAVAPLTLSEQGDKPLRQDFESVTWPLLFLLATVMVTFSAYMMYVMLSVLKGFCIYCTGSAVISFSLFLITLFGNRRHQLRRLLLVGVLVMLVVVFGTVQVYANVETVTTASGSTESAQLEPQGEPAIGVGWPISTTSGNAERQLAIHLKSIGAKVYTAWWCPHCHAQKALFGKEAMKEFPNVECDPEGENAQPKVCDAAKVEAFPTWDIKGQRLVGPQSMEILVKVSGYSGMQNFQRKLPPQ
jgi:uncharacterized membrane protein